MNNQLFLRFNGFLVSEDRENYFSNMLQGCLLALVSEHTPIMLGGKRMIKGKTHLALEIFSEKLRGLMSS